LKIAKDPFRIYHHQKEGVFGEERCMDPLMINVMIVDDQTLFSENLKLMLETLTDNIRITDIASNGKQAIELLLKKVPDIILMDVRMPEMDGVLATREIKRQYSNVQIVMLTSFLDDEYVQDALRYGATGYLLKNIKPQDLISAINSVAQSHTIMLTNSLVEGILAKEKQNPYFKNLSNRETEILRLLSHGFSNKRIAEELYISEPTVRNYISRIYAKIGSNDRLEVISMVKKSYE